MLREFLAGTDEPGRTTLPIGEFLHPAPLFALAVLVVNDHLLKGSAWMPAVITGKLSDVAGLTFFPLLLTATLDTILLGLSRLGLNTRFSLRTGRLATAVLATGLVFTAVKLSPAVADCTESLLALLGFPSTITHDPTDLIALPMLAIAYWIGRRHIASVPSARTDEVTRRWRRKNSQAGSASEYVAAELNDVARLGSRSEVDEFICALAAHLDRPDSATKSEVIVALSRLRKTRP